MFSIFGFGLHLRPADDHRRRGPLHLDQVLALPPLIQAYEERLARQRYFQPLQDGAPGGHDPGQGSGQGEAPAGDSRKEASTVPPDPLTLKLSARAAR